MNDANTRRVVEACPSIFRTIEDEVEAMQNGSLFHPIAFYFECGDGWADLLVELCQKIRLRLNELPENVAKDIVAIQVKEKYGTLRFYLSSYDQVIESFIQDATHKSRLVCEQCGNPGQLRGNAWYYVACEEHTRAEDLQNIGASELP